MVNSGKFILVDRNKIESILNEQSILISGIISDESATSLGKMLGVQLAIFGTLNDIHHEKNVTLDASLKIIDVKTGEIIVMKNDLGGGRASLCEVSNAKYKMQDGDIIKNSGKYCCSHLQVL